MLPTSNPVPINSALTKLPPAANGLPLPASELALRPAALADAFADFSEAAASLERSYGELQVEVSQLKEILAERNRALQCTLAENAEVKRTLQVILDSLPCGVLVWDGSHNPALINPEARRLLGIHGNSAWDSVPANVRNPLAQMVANASVVGSNAELCIPGDNGKRWLTVRGRRLDAIVGTSAVNGKAETAPGQVLILRDISAQRQMETEREAARNAVAHEEVSASLAREVRNSTPLVGESPALIRALERAAAAARTDADVLIEAESGTGKELLARFIHEHSQRGEKRFVAVNCAAVPESLLESELFGQANEAPTRSIRLSDGANVEELIAGLHALDAGSHEIVAIMEAIKAAGGLAADLEVI